MAIIILLIISSQYEYNKHYFRMKCIILGIIRINPRA